MIELPERPTRDDLVRIVDELVQCRGDEQEQDRIDEYLDRHLPDPNWSDILYWPDNHALAAGRGISDATAREVVDLAFEYRPIAL